MEKKHERICEVCGDKFFSSIVYGKCCSDNCRARRWRRTEKGKACLARSNRRHKRPDIEKVCIHCGNEFATARKNQKLCSVCSPVKAQYYAQKRYRVNHLEKVRVRDCIGKKALRKHYFSECCSVLGCLKEGERHHPDYSNPLEIVWLCRKHHGEEHKKLKQLQEVL